VFEPIDDGSVEMMGQQGGNQDRLFYAFNLDDYVPRSHLLRSVDRYFDLSELRHHLAPFYSHSGCPSIDPELMTRMLIARERQGLSSRFDHVEDSCRTAENVVCPR